MKCEVGGSILLTLLDGVTLGTVRIALGTAAAADGHAWHSSFISLKSYKARASDECMVEV